jgi:hypothetical protein
MGLKKSLGAGNCSDKFFYLFAFWTQSHYVVQAAHSVEILLAIMSAGITGVCHHVQLR